MQKSLKNLTFVEILSTMKLNSYILFIFLLMSGFSFAQRNRAARVETPSAQTLRAGAFIDVNAAGYAPSAYTIDQLIKNILITGGNSNCATPNISNVQVSPNLAATDVNRSWGYFNKALTAFPFTDGIVLTSGYARRAGNNFANGTLSDVLGTGGDTDLATAINVSNGQLNDATYISFDFVPSVSTISFNYIFASEEYSSSYPCTFTDGFALLIKKQGDPNYTNLAVLPNNAGPVSVTNIHPNIPGNCGSVNEQYFNGYNSNNIETNFNGRTIPLTATANVIPGQTYHFKIVLADYSDSSFDSGVFIQAGSFNIGVQIGDGTGAALPPNVNVCGPISQTMVATSQVSGATYQWFLNGNPIAGATNDTYTATQPGTYSVEVTVPGSNCPGTAQVVITSTPAPTVQNASLEVCSSTTTGVFNLTNAQPNISTTPGAVFSYYQNQADALAGNTNAIGNATAFSSANTTLYVRVQVGNCFNVAQLQLTVNQTPAIPTVTASSGVLCAGGTVTLTSNYTSGNLWSTGATTQSIVVNAAGTYTVTNSVGTCTSAPASVTITDSVDPNLQISGNLAFCQGGASTLTASADGTGNTYAWNTGATTPAITVTAAGVYTVTVTTAAGCQYVKSVTVTTDAPPTAQNAQLSECSANATATFNLTSAQNAISTTPGVTFTYYQNQTDAIAANANTIANPNAYTSPNATVYVLVKKGTCSTVVQLQLTVSSTPVVQNATLNECSVATTALFNLTAAQNLISANPNAIFSFYQNLADAQAGSANTIANPTAYTSGNALIYVLVKAGTCTSIAELQLNVVAIPVTNITQSAPAICGNTPVVLTSNYAVGNLWSNGSTNQSITVTVPGTYTLTTTNGNCTGNTASVTLVSTPDPNIQITGNLNFCQGSSTTLTATADGTSNIFSWSNGTNGNTALITTPGVYTVTVTTPSGCVFQKSVTVTMDPAIVINIATPGQINCTNSQITLNASNSVFVPNSTLLWTASGGGNIVSGANTTTPVVNAAGTYTLTITSPNPNGCSAQSQVVVVKNITPPTIAVNASSIKICKGQSVILTAAGAVTYTWTGLTGNGNTQTVTPDVTTTYSVTGVGANGCAAANPTNITIEVVPAIVSVLQNGHMCKGDALTLDAGAGPNYTYLWSTGQTSQAIDVVLPGTYSVVIDNGTCTKSVTAIVTYTVVPEIKEVVFENHTLTITATNPQGTPLEYSLDHGATWQSSNVFSGIESNMNYTITVRNQGMNCSNSVLYFTVYIPNLITPNNDGNNDTISFAELAKYDNFGGGIYDRYGKPVFKASKSNYIWNGQYINYPLPTATYWYQLHWKDPISSKLIEKTGWILLKNRD